MLRSSGHRCNNFCSWAQGPVNHIQAPSSTSFIKPDLDSTHFGAIVSSTRLWRYILSRQSFAAPSASFPCSSGALRYAWNDSIVSTRWGCCIKTSCLIFTWAAQSKKPYFSRSVVVAAKYILDINRLLMSVS